MNQSSPTRVNTHPKGVVVIGGLLLVLVALGVGSQYIQQPVSTGNLAATQPTQQTVPTQEPTEAPSTLVHQANFNGWNYIARRNADGTVNADVHFPKQSVHDLETFAAVNRALIPDVSRLDSQPHIVITMRTPTNPEQFRSWALNHGLQVQVNGLLVRNFQHELSAGAIAGEPTDPLPLDRLQSFSAPGRLLGVFGARATIPAAQLRSLAADPQVFIVDITEAIVRHDLEIHNIPRSQQGVVATESVIYDMDKLGLVPDPTPLPLPVGTAQPTIPSNP